MSVELGKNFVAGGVGGVGAVLSGHPFDTIKVRLQTMPVPLPGQQAMYNGMWDCVVKTVKYEGLFGGLYKGMSAPLVGVTPIFALSFLGNDLGRKIQESHPGQKLNAMQLAIAGGFSGFLTTSIMAPGERIKCILQVQQAATGPPKYDGPVHVVKSLWKEGGIRSIYKGTVATLLRDVPANAAYFGSYEILQRSMTPEGGDRSQVGVLRTLFAGGMAGVFNWAIAIPQDVLKSRLQTAPEGQYSGIKDVFQQLMKEEGAKGLYRGWLPVMMRAFPANAFCFLGYEGAMKVLNDYFPTNKEFA